MMPDVDTVIVAHDSGELLLEAVASAVAEVGEDSVWVVDAQSADGSIEALSERFPHVIVLHVANEGFSASNNRGIEATSAPYVFLLNPDAVVSRGALDALVAAMEAEPNAGIVAPGVLDPDGSVQEGSYGDFPSVRTRVRTALRRVFGGRGVPVTPLARMQVDWVTGAAMLVRREAIRDVGPMNEGFFLYYEDIEWCHRMWDKGWHVLVEPAGSAVHHLGKSGGALAEEAYRASFERYCDLYGLWGLKALGRVGVAVRRLFGGRQ